MLHFCSHFLVGKSTKFLKASLLWNLALILLSTATIQAQTGGALNFTNGDYVDLGPSFNSLAFGTGPFTLETWFKSSMTEGTLMSKRSVCNVSSFWNLRISAGKIRFEMMESGGTNTVDFSTPLTYNNNAWHHVAVTRSGTTVKIFMDGYVVATNTAAAVTNLNNLTDPIKLGQSACNNFVGELDETRIWTEAQSVCEIYANKNYQFNSALSSLKFNAHYNQGTAGGNNASVTSLTNSASNAIAGTLNTFALTGSSSNWVSSTCPAQGFSATPPSIQTSTSCGNYVWEGVTYINSGTYTRTLTSVVNGCDSIAQLNLTVNALPDPSINMNDSTLCSGSTGSMVVTNSNAVSYCTPTTTNNSSNSDFISWFTIAGINNTSIDGPGVYNYYTNFFGQFTAGTNVSYTIFCGGSQAQGSAIWIDYNQDGDFADAGEYVVSNPSSNFGVLSNFTVSSTAKNGLTRMRVACRRGVTPASTQSCGGYDFGEFEDYNVIISGGQPNPNIYSWTPSTFLSSSSSVNPTITNITSSTVYTVTLTDANGCSATATKSILINPLPSTPVINSSSNSLCSGTSMNLTNSPNYCTPTVSGGNINGQHYISSFSLGSGLIVNVTGDGPGVYNYYQNTSANVSTGTSYSFIIGHGGSIATSKAIWIDLNQDGDFSDVGELVISAASSNTSLSSVFVIPPTAYNGLTRMRVAVSSASGITSGQSCSGFIFGEYEDYNLNISGGYSATSWAPASPLNTSIGNPVQIINQTANTTYTVTITDVNGCTKTNTQTINILTSPNVSITASADSVCSGLPVTLTASGAISYSWSPSVSNGVAFTPSTTTTYTVTGTGANGCTDTATKQVKVLTIPTAPSITGPNSVCSGGNVLLTTATYCTPTTFPSPIFSSSYSISNLIVAEVVNNNFTNILINNSINLDSAYSNFTNQMANITAGNLYGISMTPQGSQPVYFLAFIDFNQDGDFDLSNEVISANQNPSQYTWSSIFTIPVTAKNGLTRMRLLTSSQDFSYDIACYIHDINNLSVQAYGEYEDYSINISGGVPSNLIWSPAASLSTTQGASTLTTASTNTTYTVTVTGSNGCTSSATKLVTAHTNPTVNITSSVPGICLGNSVTLTASGANQYVWSNGVVNGIAFSPTTTTTYSVIGTNASGCKDTATISIPVDTGINVPNFTASNVCDGKQGTIDLSAAYCIPTVNNNSNGSHFINNFSFNGNAIQNISGEEPNNYTYFSNLTANVNAGSVNTFTIHIGGTNSTAGFIYVDYNQDGDFDEANELVFISFGGSFSISGSFTVPSTACNGITRMRVICGNGNSSTNYSCSGFNLAEYEDYNLNISGGLDKYAWSPSSLLINNTGPKVITVPLTAATTFTVTATSAYGCTATSTATVMVNPNPVVTATSSASGICPGDSLQLGVTPIPAIGSSVGWGPTQGLSNPTIYNPKASPSIGIVYFVTVTDANGCTGFSGVSVMVNNIPNAIIVNGPNTICAGSSATLAASGADTYNWQPGNLNGDTITVSPSQTTTYTITASNSSGCTKTATKLVTVNPITVPIIYASSNAICTGATANLNVSLKTSVGPSVTILDNGPANPYPASINVSFLPSSNTHLNRVYINGLSHSYPGDIDMWLKAPNGQIVMLMSDAGSQHSIVNSNLIFEDGKPSLPYSATIAGGSYQPTNYELNGLNEPSNPSTQLSFFNGNMNGLWELYVRDDQNLDAGSITSFQLEFGVPDTSNLSIAWAANPASNQASISNPASFSTTVTPSSSAIYTAIVSDALGCSATTSVSITVNPCNTILSLKLFLEGYYSGIQSMLPVLMNEGNVSSSSNVDTITVELRNAVSPYSVLISSQAILKTDGTALVSFPTLVPNGNYYIVIRHRNSLETWSASPVAISGNSSYDFSTSASQAYGQNQVEVSPNVFALYTGDLNADENTDLLDLSILETDIVNFEFGYFNTDINGDGNVDLLDLPIVEDNINNFVFAIHP